MQINNERLYNDDLTSLPFIRSLNIGGRLRSRDFIVIHYTEGQSATAAIQWLTMPRSQVSSHIVIARDGTITQLVPFDTIAWHAGESYWKGIRYLNYYSIGIELDNAGRMIRDGNTWRASFRKEYPDSEVVQAIHKFDRKPYGWHSYSAEQIQAMIDLCKLLVTQYGIKEIIGHDDIRPKAKWDPGPAFPMEYVRVQVFGPQGNASLMDQNNVSMGMPVRKEQTAFLHTR